MRRKKTSLTATLQLCDRDRRSKRERFARQKHTAKKVKNDRRPPNDDRRLDLNISLGDKSASLVAQLITEVDSVNRLSLREQISLLEASKAEDELLASKGPDLEVIIIVGNGNCFWSALSVFLDSAGLPPESPDRSWKAPPTFSGQSTRKITNVRAPAIFFLVGA